MWNIFGGKQKPRVNRVEELADKLQAQGRIADLERELGKMEHSRLSDSEREAWWHLYGIAAFRGGRDAEALSRFETGYRKFPGSARIRFSLGQQYIRSHAIDQGFALFKECRFPELPRDYVLAQARYAYLWNRYRDGLAFIRPFYDAYQQVRVLDDHFLYVRGLPFFGTWWAYLAAFCILGDEVAELERVTDDVAQKCYDYDFGQLKTELAAYRDDRPGLLREILEKRLATSAANVPTGYTRMALAVIKSRAAVDLAAAEAALAEVSVAEHDHAWLQDVRTLALAEAAHRFGASAREAERVDAFIKRQPMLFEPDIALNFHMLRYQERLKPNATTKRS